MRSCAGPRVPVASHAYPRPDRCYLSLKVEHTHACTSRIRDVGREARVLLVLDPPVLAEHIKLALNHDMYHTRGGAP